MALTRFGKRRGRVLPKTFLAIGAVSAAVALAACGGGGGTSTPKSDASSPTGTGTTQQSSGSASGLDIYFVAGATSDPFMSAIKRGADDAAKALSANGGTLHWLPLQNYNNYGPDLVQLMRTAMGAHPAAIIAPDWVPDTEDATFKQISANGTPLILFNQGAGSGTSVSEVGAQYYIGSDASASGKLAGQYMVQHGVKHALCVNTGPGTSIQEQRCAGLKAGMQTGGGAYTELELPSTNFGNPTSVAQAIKAAVLKDSSIDGVLTVDLSDADTAASALSQANLTSKVQLGTFDLNSTQLQRIQAGTQMLAIDQEPYMQGYLAVSLAYQYAKFGVKLPQTSILTGPALITKANVAAAITGAKYGAR